MNSFFRVRQLYEYLKRRKTKLVMQMTCFSRLNRDEIIASRMHVNLKKKIVLLFVIGIVFFFVLYIYKQFYLVYVFYIGANANSNFCFGSVHVVAIGVKLDIIFVSIEKYIFLKHIVSLSFDLCLKNKLTT